MVNGLWWTFQYSDNVDVLLQGTVNISKVDASRYKLTASGHKLIVMEILVNWIFPMNQCLCVSTKVIVQIMVFKNC